MVIESMKKSKKKTKSTFEVLEDINLPYFTHYTWSILAGIGIVGGIVGGMLYSALMAQFCK